MASDWQTRRAVTLATAIDVGAVALLVGGSHTTVACWLALAVHLGATASLLRLLPGHLPASRRFLVIAFGFTMPIVGASLALLSLTNGAPSELETAIAAHTAPEPDEGCDDPSSPDPRAIRKLGEALSLPEALLVADVEQRRATLWSLGRRGDREAIALLRWALTATSPELGLEAALALEDVAVGFQKRLDAHRRALAQAPTRATALAAADLITHGFEIGILDGSCIDVFAAEARRHCTRARKLDPTATSEIALCRARLEIAVLRPDAALVVIDQALPTATPALHAELSQLRDEAAMRANNLPWEGSSALLTYRRPLPPHTTHRHVEATYPDPVLQIA